MLNSFLIC